MTSLKDVSAPHAGLPHIDEDSTALAHRLMAEHERGLHDGSPHPICPLCEYAIRRERARCRLSRIQAAVARVVYATESGLSEGWVTDTLWDAKEDLEECAGLIATARYVDATVEVLRRERLIEVQHAFNIMAIICEAEEPAASSSFWDAMYELRGELTQGPEATH
ncbi:MAG: hypothetical protein AAFU77_16620 [Myxococcota bacterium]